MHIGIRIAITIVCLCLSGTFSGLTLGLMSLGVMDLHVLMESGSDSEKYHAKRILPLRKRGNFLLCTLLIGNTAVNSALSIVTADLFGGLPGFIASTVAILYIGEIVPQAVCYRYGLIIGSFAVPLVKFFMVLTAPLSYPTSLLLDYTLGTEPTTRYNKSQLRSLLSIHGNRSEAEPDVENGEATKPSPFASRDMAVREIIPHPPNESADRITHRVSKVISADAEVPAEEKRSLRTIFAYPRNAFRSRRRKRSASHTSGEEDLVDGMERPSRKNRSERNNAQGLLTREEMAIFGSAFEFKDKKVSQVMTHLDKVFMLDASLSLNFNVMLIVFQSGHSRIPVYEGNRSNIIGVLFAKDLILLDPEDCVPMKTILHFFNRPVLCVYDDTPLFEMLNIFKQGRGHMAVVQRVVTDTDADPSLGTLGIATLEDLIEELIGEDIVDETDVYTDNVSRLPVKRIRSIDPEVLKMFDSRHVEERLSQKEVLVVSSYLYHNTHEFSEACVRLKILRETLANAPIEEYFDPAAGVPERKRSGSSAPLPGLPAGGAAVDGAGGGKDSLRRRIGHKVPAGGAGHAEGEGGAALEEDDGDIFIYKRGVPSINAYLILHGRLEICAGNDGFISEAGPWTLLGVHALVDDLYAPDFTARVLERPARLLRLSRKFYRVLQQYSGENPLAPLVDARPHPPRVSPHTFERAATRAGSAPPPAVPPLPGAAGPVAGGGSADTPPKAVRIVSASTPAGRPLQWGEIEPVPATDAPRGVVGKPAAEDDIVKNDDV